jgi:hypothetical protein
LAAKVPGVGGAAWAVADSASAAASAVVAVMALIFWLLFTCYPLLRKYTKDRLLSAFIALIATVFSPVGALS